MSELIFDKYEIQHRLAVGGMGEVFYAVQKGAVRGFERPVILKNLLPDLAQQEGFIEQFLDEARVAATLNHPNVVSIYEVGLWNGTYFIAMEFIRGRNLSQLIKASIKKQLPIPPAVVARVVRDAALGLDHAHTAKDGQSKPLNIVHRDISPQNIMVRDDGVTKVVDFGVAAAANKSSRTATGTVKGKLAYMAPEQIASRHIDGLADQFALGVVLWELCTRRRLFQAERDLDLVKKVLEAEVPRPSTVVSGLPEDLDEISLRMLQRDPAQRFGSAAEVARELETFLVKFSPPSSESPVASYMKQLGIEDLQIQPSRATPSGANFVISLKGAPGATATTPSMAQRTGRRGAAFALVGAVVIGLGITAGALYPWREGPAVEPVADVAPALKPPEPAPPEPAPLPVPKPPVKLSVVSTPSGASVRLNGRKSGETPLTQELPPGTQLHLQVDKPGYLAFEQDVTVDAPRKLEVTLKKRSGRDREPKDTAASSEPGYISIDTVPWTKVSVDGDPFGSTPIFKKKLNAGKHVVVMETEGGVKLTRSVEIKSGDVTKLQLDVK